jgi:hypothetical protein
MRVEAEIQLDRVEDVLSVPVTSIFSEGPLRFVYRLQNKAGGIGSGVERVPIRIGRRSDRFAEVLSGLSAGDLVVVRDLKPGEIQPQKWTEQQLAAGGCRRAPDGSIVLIAPEKKPEVAKAGPPSAPSPAEPNGKPPADPSPDGTANGQEVMSTPDADVATTPGG